MTMTEAPDRIRWIEPNEPNDLAELSGYVGTIGLPMFKIYAPAERGGSHAADWLLTCRLAYQDVMRYGGSREEMQDGAERWLEEFAASIGAIFPEPAEDLFDDGEQLEVKYAAGRRVCYAHPDAGHHGEQEHVAASLVLGEVYTIGWADIGQSRTDLNLYREGRSMGRFNSVFFEPADDEIAPEVTAATAATKESGNA